MCDTIRAHRRRRFAARVAQRSLQWTVSNIALRPSLFACGLAVARHTLVGVGGMFSMHTTGATGETRAIDALTKNWSPVSDSGTRPTYAVRQSSRRLQASSLSACLSLSYFSFS